MKNLPITHNLGFLLPCFFLFYACSHQISSFTAFQEIDKKGWQRTFEPSCEVALDDSLTLYHIDITGRLRYAYVPDSLSLSVQVTAPSGISFCDTVSFAVAHVRSHLWEDFRFPYCSHVRFLETGLWRFSFDHNMGAETLKGVMFVGVSIHKEEP